MKIEAIPAHPAIVLLRISVAALLFTHGAARAFTGGVAPFGEYLDSKGFPYGVVWAGAITAIELLATPLLVIGRLVVPISAYFIFQLALGIFMVHWTQGWFVVGLGRNGMEYSALLILCFACLLLSHWKNTPRNRQ